MFDTRRIAEMLAGEISDLISAHLEESSPFRGSNIDRAENALVDTIMHLIEAEIENKVKISARYKD